MPAWLGSCAMLSAGRFFLRAVTQAAAGGEAGCRMPRERCVAFVEGDNPLEGENALVRLRLLPLAAGWRTRLFARSRVFRCTAKKHCQCAGAGLDFAACGCSSMVEQKLPKLTTRVRFPSPAPFPSHRVQGYPIAPASMIFLSEMSRQQVRLSSSALLCLIDCFVAHAKSSGCVLLPSISVHGHPVQVELAAGKWGWLGIESGMGMMRRLP